MTATTYIVICRGDRGPERKKGPYELATRQVFRSRAAATLYCEGISPSREAMIVEGDFAHLRFGP